jgi:hypothetical protein
MRKSKKCKRKQRKSKKSRNFRKSIKLRYKKGGGKGECPICFEDKTLCNLVGCTHQICENCYDSLIGQKKCPLCRANVTGLKCDGKLVRGLGPQRYEFYEQDEQDEQDIIMDDNAPPRYRWR